MNSKSNSSKKEEKFFYFSASQRKGMFVLVVLMTLVIAGFFIYPFLIKKTEQTDFSDFEKQIALYEKGIEEVVESRKQQQFNYNNVNRSFAKIQLNPFPFDPNTLSQTEWATLGLRPKQIQTIQNYLSKGGKFRRKEDFKKMYCISDAEYQILEPHIVIAPANTAKDFYKEAKPTETSRSSERMLSIDINTADTLEMQELKGIGPAFARRITKYRELLGGFYTSNQLLEVYGFTPEMLEKIRNSIVFDPTKIRKININATSIDKLKAHPYIDFYMAKAIVKYREGYQRFTTVEDIRKVNLVNDSIFEKLKPYLSVE